MSVTETETPALPEVEEGRLVQNFMRECGRVDPIFLEAEGYIAEWVQPDRAGGNWWAPMERRRLRHKLHITEAGALVVDWNRPRERVELGRFVGSRRELGTGGALLLNGDGLREGQQQALQTRVRDRAQRVFGVLGTLVIPYRALASAGIDLDSIRPIHISGERNEPRNYDVARIPNVRVNGTQYSRVFGARAPIRGRESDPITHEGRRYRVRCYTPGNHLRERYQVQVEFQPENGRLQWWPVRERDGSWQVSAAVHRLGASVFLAETSDGRHRFISAFDEVDRGMYYLAQLPDDAEVTNYESALAALAPPIVHEARKQGREVYRQGDIFFVETNLSRRDIVERASTVTRRTEVMRGDTPIPRSRRRGRLMIYGTGHTATVVAKMRDGAEFVTGTAHHDPGLETRGRRREHRDIQLGNKWFLCVRNTVPRQS